MAGAPIGGDVMRDCRSLQPQLSECRFPIGVRLDPKDDVEADDD